MYQNKFNIGDKVRIIGEKYDRTDGTECVVTAIREDEVDVTNSVPGAFFFGVGYEYHYNLKCLDNGDAIKCEESELELIPKTQEELNMELFKESMNNEEIEPQFQVGDVVMLRGGKRQYVIKESIINTSIDAKVIYEAAPLNSDEELYHYMESALEFQYHDKKLEEYYTESVRNGLPAWRGKTYNLFALYANFETKKGYDITWKDYNNDTIPVPFMEHIIKKHTFYGAIDRVTGSNCTDKGALVLRERFNLSQDELKSIKSSILDKIDQMNLTGVDPKYRRKGHNSVNFTSDEWDIIKEVDKLDIVDGEPVSHYPATMSNPQIMDAIKEAYENASKEGSISMKKDTKDLRTGEYVYPVKGYRKYKGKSGDLTICFLYNYDLNLITTAYPPIAKKPKPDPKSESTDICDKEAIQNYLQNKMNNSSAYGEMGNDAVAGFMGNMVQKSPISESAPVSKLLPFQVGNRVKIVDGFGLDGEGVILECGERDYEWQEFRVRLDGENADRVYYKKNMELIADAPYLESSGTGPKFRSGDVVYVIDTPYKTNVAIMEAVSQDETTGEYVYKAALTFNGDIHQYHESELSYLYHDTKREIHKK